MLGDWIDQSVCIVDCLLTTTDRGDAERDFVTSESTTFYSFIGRVMQYAGHITCCVAIMSQKQGSNHTEETTIICSLKFSDYKLLALNIDELNI